MHQSWWTKLIFLKQYLHNCMRTGCLCIKQNNIIKGVLRYVRYTNSITLWYRRCSSLLSTNTFTSCRLLISHLLLPELRPSWISWNNDSCNSAVHLQPLPIRVNGCYANLWIRGADKIILCMEMYPCLQSAIDYTGRGAHGCLNWNWNRQWRQNAFYLCTALSPIDHN